MQNASFPLGLDAPGCLTVVQVSNLCITLLCCKIALNSVSEKSLLPLELKWDAACIHYTVDAICNQGCVSVCIVHSVTGSTLISGQRDLSSRTIK